MQIQLKGFSNAAVVPFLPLSPSRVYLVAQERQDEVSNWLCVQVMLSTSSTTASPRQKERKSEPYEEEKKTLVISEK